MLLGPAVAICEAGTSPAQTVCGPHVNMRCVLMGREGAVRSEKASLSAHECGMLQLPHEGHHVCMTLTASAACLQPGAGQQPPPI